MVSWFWIWSAVGRHDFPNNHSHNYHRPGNSRRYNYRWLCADVCTEIPTSRWLYRDLELLLGDQLKRQNAQDFSVSAEFKCQNFMIIVLHNMMYYIVQYTFVL